MTIFENFEANERQEEVVGGKTKLVIRNDFSPFPLPPSPFPTRQKHPNCLCRKPGCDSQSNSKFYLITLRLGRGEREGGVGWVGMM